MSNQILFPERQHYAKSPFRMKNRGGYRVENKADKEATVYIYDEISWWGIEAGQFVKDLQSIDTETLHVRINSPGGSVFDGTAIYNALKQHPAKVKVHVDGLAASIASVIAMAGDEIIMGDGSYLMIHDPFSIAMGTAEDFRKEADLLDKVCDTICQVYQDKCGKTPDEIKKMMGEETWMTAQEAVEMGFADSMDKGKEKKSQAKNLFDLSVFANVPDTLREHKDLPDERNLERVLRDAGCSKKMAQTILAKGYTESLRDSDTNDIIPPAEPLRDAEAEKPVKAKDRTADLLIRAEIVAPRMAA